jgi:hypothetical protein
MPDARFFGRSDTNIRFQKNSGRRAAVRFLFTDNPKLLRHRINITAVSVPQPPF